MVETLYTIKEVATILRVKPVTVRRLIAAEKIQIVRVGRQIRISEAALNTYLEAHTDN